MGQDNERNIIKAISVLGSVQIINIIIGICRSKVISILMGPAGMGILSLYQSTSDIVSSISNMGLSTTAVKDISKSYSQEDITNVSYVISVFRKLINLTGFASLLICTIFSPLFSYINFGDYQHTYFFILLGLSLFMIQQVAGYTTLLQGSRNFKKMAQGTMAGNVIGLFFCIPLYYIWRETAIVPVLVLSSIINFFVLRYFSDKMNIPIIRVGYKEAVRYGNSMLKTGFFVCLQGLFALLYIYMLRLYITHTSSLKDVGLFNAGMIIVNTYVGLIFSSMGTEYYPRLSSINNNDAFISTINNQIVRCITLLTPLICLLLFLMPVVIRILYTEQFLPISLMSMLLLTSVCFKVFEWSIGFSFLAKGKTNVLFINELFFKIYTFLISILLFERVSLTGIGVSYIISEILFCFQSFLVSKKIFNFCVYKETYLSLLGASSMVTICMLSIVFDFKFKIIICSICLCISIYRMYQYYQKNIRHA